MEKETPPVLITVRLGGSNCLDQTGEELVVFDVQRDDPADNGDHHSGQNLGENFRLYQLPAVCIQFEYLERPPVVTVGDGKKPILQNAKYEGIQNKIEWRLLAPQSIASVNLYPDQPQYVDVC